MMIAPCSVVRRAEQRAFAAGITDAASLMDEVVQRLHRAVRQAGIAPQRVVVYAGTGNNAGDALGLAAALGSPVLLRCAEAAHRLSPDSARQRERCADLCVLDRAPEPQPHTLILDGLLGSGAGGALRPAYAALCAEMNALRAASPHSLLLAVDIPTGLDAESGEGMGVRADISCPIGCVKPGMLADAAVDAVGRIMPIPLPSCVLPDEGAGDRVLAPGEPLLQLPRRAYSCFKNRAGRVAVVAGSCGMLGAAQMAAEAAAAAGAGLVELYCRADIYPLLAARVAPEIMVRCAESYTELAELQVQALLIGPGLGALTRAEAEALHRLAMRFAGTVVLDADGLNAVAAHGLSIGAHWILTPHPGEMRRLDPRPAASRREQLRRFVEEHGCTLLLKGARSLIGDRSCCVYNSTGGPYMANGGQGDVLSGVVAALAAQGCPPLQAAAAGAYHCGLAAERVWSRKGFAGVVRASELLRELAVC